MQSKTFYANCRSKGMNIPMDECERLRSEWLAAFPEMDEYFKSVERVESSERNRGGDYKSWSFTGRWRRYCSFCSACNYRFQAPAADGAKVALWYCFYWNLDNDDMLKMVNFIHDEIIFELQEDIAPELAVIAQDLMEQGMATIVTHVKVKAEPTLMRCWTKKAKAVYDENGRLKVWEPEPEEKAS